MRTDHKAHSFQAFPVYSSVFISDYQLVLGGGGGASRTGIQNRLRLYDIAADKSLVLIDEHELAAGEDAPMSMTTHYKSSTVICGVNSIAEQLEKGNNENCRVFAIEDSKLRPSNTRGTLSNSDLDDYQKVTVLSPDGAFLAVAGSHDMSLLSYPSLKSAALPIHTDKEIYDVTMSERTLVIATTSNLLIYDLPEQIHDKDEALISLELVKIVDLPSSSDDGSTSAFRSARYNPTDPDILYTVVNSSFPRTRKTRIPGRVAYVCKWDTKTWTTTIKRKVGDRNLTCLDISASGQFLAFGSSDLTVGFLDALTLNPLMNILKAHEFPPTTIAFNPSSTLLVSGSADNTVRVITVPDAAANSWSWSFVLLSITILILLLAVAAAKHVGTGELPW